MKIVYTCEKCCNAPVKKQGGICDRCLEKKTTSHFLNKFGFVLIKKKSKVIKK